TRSVALRPSTSMDTTANSAPFRAQETPGADAAKVITASPSRGAVNGSDRAGPPRSTTIVPGTETTAGRAAAWWAAAGWAAAVRGAPARAAPVRTSTA